MMISALRMSAGRCFVILAFLLLSLAPGAMAQERPQDLFQRALRLERVSGDLMGAIHLYQQVVEGADRSLAARALLRIGEGYEKLGDQEARSAYSRVVREFGDQAEAVALAQQRLSAMGTPIGAAAPATLSPATLTQRLVWEDPGVDVEGQPTPDGQWISFADWGTGGNLALHNLATGEKRLLTTEADDRAYALLNVVSPDGARAAYFWTPPGWHSQLRVVGTDGSGQKTLLTNEDGSIDYLEPHDWTPDNEKIFVQLSLASGTHRLALVSADDGSTETVLDIAPERGHPLLAHLSPDGRWVAYDLPAADGSAARDIHVVGVDGQGEGVLIGHSANDLHPIFSPDGRFLLFSSDRSGSVDLWAVPFRDGLTDGEPLLVKAGLGAGFWPMGFSSDGRLFVAVDAGGGDVYTAPIDPSTGRLVGEPTKAVDVFEGRNTAPHWSRNGRTMVYLSRRNLLSLGQGIRLIVRDIGTSTETEPETGIRPHRKWTRPRVSPDGSKVLVSRSSFPEVDGEALVLVDLASGGAESLVPASDETAPWSARWSRDGRHIYYMVGGRTADIRLDAWGIRIMRMELATRETEVIHEFAGSVPPGVWALSPDETRLAFAEAESDTTLALVVMDLATGSRRKIHSVTKPEFITESVGLIWTADGSHILFALNDQAPWEERQVRELLSVPVAGGPAFSTGLEMEELRTVVLLPDGEHVGFGAGPTTKKQVWVLENLFAEGGR